MDRLDFQAAAEAALHLAISANGFLNERAPWSRIKQEGQLAVVGEDLYAVLESARLVALLIAALVPELSERMLAQLGQPPAASGTPSVIEGPGTVGAPPEIAGIPSPSPWLERLRWGGLQPALPLPEPQPVMARLELDGPL